MDNKLKTVGDIKNYLKNIDDNLPLFINANERHSCCGQENCYCSQEYKEFDIAWISECAEEKEVKPRSHWFTGRRFRPKRIVINLND